MVARPVKTLTILPILVLLALFAPAAQARPGELSMFQADRELLGSDDALRTSTIDEIAGLGANALHVDLYWRSVAPSPDAASAPSFDQTDPAAYDWSRYDWVVDAARARGMRVLLTLTGPVPQWATKAHKDQLTRPRADMFERFAVAAGRHFGSRIGLWSIWNEPNHPKFLLPQFSGHGSKRHAASPAIYRALYQAGLRGLQHSGNKRDTILMGETSPRGNSQVVAPLVLLRGALGLSSSYHRLPHVKPLRVNGWATHPYTAAVGPYYRPPNRDDVTIGSLDRLRAALDKAHRAGVIGRGVGIYVTEYGVQSKPDTYGVSLQQQAEYLATSERITWHDSRVLSSSQYLMRDDLPRTGVPAFERYSGFESGLRFSDGRAKPALDGYRLPLAAARSGGGVALWGLVRPAHGRTTVRVEYHGSGGWKKLLSKRTDGRGAWQARTRYVSGRVYRVRWKSFTGATIRVYRR